jgi:hypothetical protein
MQQALQKILQQRRLPLLWPPVAVGVVAGMAGEQHQLWLYQCCKRSSSPSSSQLVLQVLQMTPQQQCL